MIKLKTIQLSSAGQTTPIISLPFMKSLALKSIPEPTAVELNLDNPTISEANCTTSKGAYHGIKNL